jgi:hypothetical protein
MNGAVSPSPQSFGNTHERRGRAATNEAVKDIDVFGDAPAALCIPRDRVGPEVRSALRGNVCRTREDFGDRPPASTSTWPAAGNIMPATILGSENPAAGKCRHDVRAASPITISRADRP